MNNFDGQLKLYPEICIDNFSSDVLFNLRIRCYILTHFHDDHMKNLEDYNFYRILSENNGISKFYCSTITKKFIQTCEKYQHLSDVCQEVTSESPFIVNISAKETVTITFCGSGIKYNKNKVRGKLVKLNKVFLLNKLKAIVRDP